MKIFERKIFYRIVTSVIFFSSVAVNADPKEGWNTKRGDQLQGIEYGIRVGAFFSVLETEPTAVDGTISHLRKHFPNLSEDTLSKMVTYATGEHRRIVRKFQADYVNSLCKADFKPGLLNKFQKNVEQSKYTRYLSSYQDLLIKFPLEVQDEIELMLREVTKNTEVHQKPLIAILASSGERPEDYITRVCNSHSHLGEIYE